MGRKESEAVFSVPSRTTSHAHPQSPLVAMKYSILVLLCISLALCAYSLDKWELEALRDIRSAWGAFSSTDRTWPEQVEEACNDPPFPYLGCTEGPNPHVLSLYVAFSIVALFYTTFSFTRNRTLLLLTLL